MRIARWTTALPLALPACLNDPGLIVGPEEGACPHVVGEELDLDDVRLGYAPSDVIAAMNVDVEEEPAELMDGFGASVPPPVTMDAMHTFTFHSVHEASYSASEHPLNAGCPFGEGMVVEAEQHILVSFGSFEVEGRAPVTLFVGGADPEQIVGLTERAAVSPTQELTEAVEAAVGAPGCGPDEYAVGPVVDYTRSWAQESARVGEVWFTRTPCGDDYLAMATVIYRDKDGPYGTRTSE